MNKPITNFDLEKLFGNDMLIVSYDKLKKIKSLDDLFKHRKYLCILYQYKPNYGHWVLILKTINKQNKPVIEFFDPYGDKPDSQLKHFSTKIRDVYGMRYPQLANLMIESSYPLEYNNHRLQKMDPKVQTCGRWCAFRAIFDDVPIDQFANMFQGKTKSPDEIIVKASKKISL